MRKFFLFLLGTFIAITFFELFLRFSPFELGVSPVHYDAEVGMWHKENFSSNKISECYNTPYYFDEKGLIKNNYTYNPNKKDILIFGDSYIEALMVHNPNIIHNALYKVFQGKYNFINYGLSGISPIQEYIMMTKKVDFRHTKALLQFIRIESDIYDVDPSNLDSTARPTVFMHFKDKEHYTTTPPKPYDLKEKIRDFMGSFELYIFLRKGIYYMKQHLQTKKKKKIIKKEKEDLTINWRQIEGVLYQTKKLLLAKHISYTVLLYGSNKAMNKHLKVLLDSLNISYYDLVDFAKKRNFTLEHFPCDSHWNDATHLQIADIIKKEHLLE